MEINKVIQGEFSNHFNAQLRSIMEHSARDTFIKLNFSLPRNQRYPYVGKDYLYSEVKETLDKFYPLGARLIYVRPAPTDDHFIEVGVLVKINF